MSQPNSSSKTTPYLQRPVGTTSTEGLVGSLQVQFRRCVEKPGSVPDECREWTDACLQQAEAWSKVLKEIVEAASNDENSKAHRALQITPSNDGSGSYSKTLSAPWTDPSGMDIRFGNLELGRAYAQAIIPQLLYRIDLILKVIDRSKNRTDTAICKKLHLIQKFADKMFEENNHYSKIISDHRKKYREENPDSRTSHRSPPREPRSVTPPLSAPVPTRSDLGAWKRRPKIEPDTQEATTTTSTTPPALPEAPPKEAPPGIAQPTCSQLFSIPAIVSQTGTGYEVKEMLVDASMEGIASIRFIGRENSDLVVKKVYLIPGIFREMPEKFKIYMPSGSFEYCLISHEIRNMLQENNMPVFRNGRAEGIESVYIIPGFSPAVNRL